MMSRTQIALDAEAHRRARKRAADLGLSLAAYIRLLIQRDLDEPDRADTDIGRIIGLVDSGGSDVARHKDEYIDEALRAVDVRRVAEARV